MKGKLILIPLKEPKEGMKVVTKNMIGYSIGTIQEILDPIGSINVGMSKGMYNYSLSELQQIAVEYTEESYDSNDTFPRRTLKYILPLHPDDYEKALPLIGKEVEFFNPMGSEHAELVEFDDIPTPVMYTEEEVYQICLSGAAVTKMMCAKNEMWSFDDWWNENKKK